METTDDNVTCYEDGSIQVTSGTKKMKMNDGSTHLIPVVNRVAMEQARNRSRIMDKTDNPDLGGMNETSVVTVNETNSELNLSWIEIADLVRNKGELLIFLKERKLINSHQECSNCQQDMKWTEANKLEEGYRWYCSRCKKAVSIKKDSFFFKTKLSIADIFSILYFWSMGIQGFIAERMITNIIRKTIYDYYNFARDICVKYVESKICMFDLSGDFEIEIQVDESVFRKVRKYNRGKSYKQTWIFGISQPQNHKCYLQIVEDRTAATLVKIIKDRVPMEANIRIISDGWASYNTLRDEGYEYSIVVHKEEFVNDEGKNTNSVESIWAQMKNWIRSMHGLRREHLNNYICEFMFRYNLCGSTRASCMNHLLENIAEFYPTIHK